MKKMTKKEMFTALMENYPLTEAEIKFVKHEIELLEKKNSGKSKVSAAEQEKRDALAGAIVEVLSNATEPMPNKAIVKELMALDMDCSTQKLTPILTKMVGAGTISCEKVKGVNVYSIV